MKNSQLFIFDVDGTLTPSRGFIDTEFKEWFNKFARMYPVVLVTGSDKPKTVEQIGEDTYNLCHTVYNCNGNDVWQSNKHIRSTDWKLEDGPYFWLAEQLTQSEFPLRTGLHFEHRPGMVNYSIVGRNANQEERLLYVDWDIEHKERYDIADKFNVLYPDLEAKVGGETGIDISPKGNNKSQILDDFPDATKIVFFGDRIDPDGNDWPLAQRIVDNGRGFCYNIQNWQETWSELKQLCPDV